MNLPTFDQGKIGYLEREVEKLRRENQRLRDEVTGYQIRHQEVVGKWRARNQVLAQELQLAQVGLTSGCGCPIGQCQREKSRGSACWLQWSESHLARRIADIRISELQRHAVHPSRFAQARAEGKQVQRLQSPEPDEAAPDPNPVIEPGITPG